MKVAFLFVLLLEMVGTASANQVQLVTELGNIFLAEPAFSQSSSLEQVNSYIHTIDLKGAAIGGQIVVGWENSLVPYIESPKATFAAVITEDDPEVVLPVPEFGREYRYVNGTLVPIPYDAPNLLGYTKAINHLGPTGVTLDSNGIHIDGPPKSVHTHQTSHCPSQYHCHVHTSSHTHGIDLVVVQLSPMSQLKTLLRGNVTGDYLKVVKSNFDLAGIGFEESKGFRIHESSQTYLNLVRSYSERHVLRGGSSYTHTHYVYETVQDLSLTVKSLQSITAEFQASWTQCSGAKWWKKCWIEHQTYPASVTGSQLPDGYHITRLSAPTTHPGKFVIYSMTPYTVLASFENDFEVIFDFPGGDGVFLLAQPDGTITVKAEKFDPQRGVWFQVKDLPPNTPFRLEKNGLVGTRGLSPSDGGDVVLRAADVDIQGGTPGGVLKIYPDSLHYRGDFHTLVFDTLNGHLVKVNDTKKRLYTPFAYLKIPFAANTTVSSVRAGDVSLDYLAGVYGGGSALEIPILPAMKAVTVEANGKNNTINLADVAARSAAKIVPPREATISMYSIGGPVSSIHSDVGSGVFVIASGRGQMYAMLTLSVSGDSGFSNDVTLYLVPDPPPPPPPKDPLSVFVDVYKNGQLIQSHKVYYDDKPLFEPVTRLNGLSLHQAITYHYNQRTVTSMVLVDVEAGDMVEFYVRTSLRAEGIPVTIPATQGSRYVADQTVSAAYATSRIHGGSILAGMAG